MKNTLIASICICGLIIGLFYLHYNRVDIQNLKEQVILMNRSIIANTPVDETKVLNFLIGQKREINDKLTVIDSELTEITKTLTEFTNEVHTQVIALSEDQSETAENLRHNIISLEHQVLALQESLRFFLPQQRITSAQQALISSQSQTSYVTEDVIDLDEIPLTEIQKASSREKRFPVLGYIRDKGYRIFDDGTDILILKDKGVQEHLAYQLTSLFTPGANPIPSRYVTKLQLNNETLHGTLQKFLKNVQTLDSNHLHNLNVKQLQEVYRILLIDYMIGNSDRDFLYDSSRDLIVGVDVDESFDYNYDDWFSEESFFHQVLVVTNQDPVIQEWLIREQYRMQSIPDEYIRIHFQNLPESAPWAPELSRRECLEELINRKANLHKFVLKTLTAMRF